MAGSQLVKRPKNAVDPHEEPSAEWGWHGRFPRGREIGGWISVIGLFAMAFIGNHVAPTEQLWMAGLGIAVAAGLVWSRVRQRTAWRR
ncbi:DUF2631 domain-containing protein [Actinophytocola gossypii]|uniref:DUF2631 domain-containing protein n=1 Tax=Actinophytocola gossypii TaxID=2812003 RepID=A0ABT2JAF6_9PSEU|nr:DUF2631 domain-containing protein [Actinophytocola gossypii]MCT2584696.1 DUF2631 domain-containing protein [Actinophytocola gossypii]